MIYGLFQAVKEDAAVLTHWLKGEELTDATEDEQQQRIQAAAARMLACVAMAFGSLWALSLLMFVVTIPLTILLKLATAVGVYVLAHDVFMMTQNACEEEFQETMISRLGNLFRGKEALEEDQARKFTHGTLLQPAWMWMYVNRHKVIDQIP